MTHSLASPALPASGPLLWTSQSSSSFVEAHRAVMRERGRQRFSLLHLDPGELYLEDFSVHLLMPIESAVNMGTRKVRGRLKLCTSSLVFEPVSDGLVSSPGDLLPLIRLRFRDITSVSSGSADRRAKVQAASRQSSGMLDSLLSLASFPTSSAGSGSSSASSDGLVVIETTRSIEMMAGGVAAPYLVKKDPPAFRFELNHVGLGTFLMTLQKYRSLDQLHAQDREVELRRIVHQLKEESKFDPAWLVSLDEACLRTYSCSRITPLVAMPGKLTITKERVYFHPISSIDPDPVSSYPVADIRQLVPRRYLMRQVGLELHMKDRRTLFVSFASRADRDHAHRLIQQQPGMGRSLATDSSRDALHLWQTGRISNYDYLWYLNSKADRTVNDLTQYPVFPWILSDYTSPTLDLSNPAVYRDLSKPIGALNPERLAALRDRYNEMPPPRFLYGTHYSTPGYVLYYLVRVAPEHALCLHGGKYDAADGRVFSRLASTWNNLLHGNSDVKELIPEFFQLPEDIQDDGYECFLENKRGLIQPSADPGSAAARLPDVELPPWAKNDPTKFIRMHREALESDFVSANLHKWIDLIFGYKQNGVEADKADNVFYHLTYEGSVDLDSITDPGERAVLELQITEFGQTPRQLFQVPHPARLSRAERDAIAASPVVEPLPSGGVSSPAGLGPGFGRPAPLVTGLSPGLGALGAGDLANSGDYYSPGGYASVCSSDLYYSPGGYASGGPHHQPTPGSVASPTPIVSSRISNIIGSHLTGVSSPVRPHFLGGEDGVPGFNAGGTPSSPTHHPYSYQLAEEAASPSLATPRGFGYDDVPVMTLRPVAGPGSPVVPYDLGGSSTPVRATGASAASPELAVTLADLRLYDSPAMGPGAGGGIAPSPGGLLLDERSEERRLAVTLADLRLYDSPAMGPGAGGGIAPSPGGLLLDEAAGRSRAGSLAGGLGPGGLAEGNATGSSIAPGAPGIEAGASWTTIESLELLFSDRLHRDCVTGIALAGAGDNFFTVSRDGSLKTFSIVERRQTKAMSLGGNTLSSCGVKSAEGCLDPVVVIGSWDSNVYLYSTTSGRIVETISAHENVVSAVQVSGPLLATASWDSTIRLWSSPVGTIGGRTVLVHELHDNHTEVHAISLSACGRLLVSGAADGLVCVWGLPGLEAMASGAAAPSLLASDFLPGAATALALVGGATASRLALASGYSPVPGESCSSVPPAVRIVDVDTLGGRTSLPLPTEGDTIRVFAGIDAPSPGSLGQGSAADRFLLGGGDSGQIFVWDLVQCVILCRVAAHNGPVTSLAVSPAGIVVSGSMDNTVKIWSINGLGNLSARTSST
ncbi:hypothetical protein H696_00503 [Fonticula alba]|uniref:BEACH domain-containing protein n=1 Tax=Fonticula alba TaxID=691883 RepID=A0A058ZEZ9_FONAL|nr:hypothetical protein H696_00503 [Fonticula alba]KCV72949.1 hypothetical protein H696_00503 [Fonticula alba]|eukprot:XP_009492650.1 hypothetical protein H696_00503 [Fonticula alba]